MFIIRWTDAASDSYNKEADFIFNKWNIVEVTKFIDLVDAFLKTLETGVLYGKASKKKEIRISVISKQTSLAYRVDEKNNIIHLILFWNNKENPKGFERFLRR